MILEEKISNLKKPSHMISVEYWGWYSKHMSLFFNQPCNYVKNADKLIKNASLEICLTSPIRYIRECKKWFEVHKNDT